MNYREAACKFETTSKVCAVATAAAIVLSTTPAAVLFNLTILFSLVAGNLREKLQFILANPLTIPFVAFFCLFLFGSLYSTASLSDILIDLRKGSKFLLALIFLPIFSEEKWRNYAILSFMAAIFVMLICSYFPPLGYMRWALKGNKFAGEIEVFKIAMEFNSLMALGVYFCFIQIFCNHSARYRSLWEIFCGLLIYTVLFRSTGRSGYFIFIGLTMLFFTQRFKWRGFYGSVVCVILLCTLAYLFSNAFHDRNSVALNEFINYIKVANKTTKIASKINTVEEIKDELPFRNGSSSIGLRLVFLKNGLSLIKVHPIFGTGTGSYINEYVSIKPMPQDIEFFYPPNPHNEYLHVAISFGIIGLMVLALFFSVPIVFSKSLPEKENYIVRGIVVTIMIGSFANNWLTVMTMRYLYTYFVVLTFAAFHTQKA
jgi:hypothetical protein